MVKLIMVICALIASTGIRGEIVAGVRTSENGDGKVIYDSLYEVDEEYDYISYDPGEIGEEIVTVFFLGNSGEPDDYIFRRDFAVK